MKIYQKNKDNLTIDFEKENVDNIEITQVGDEQPSIVAGGDPVGGNQDVFFDVNVEIDPSGDRTYSFKEGTNINTLRDCMSNNAGSYRGVILRATTADGHIDASRIYTFPVECNGVVAGGYQASRVAFFTSGVVVETLTFSPRSTITHNSARYDATT